MVRRTAHLLLAVSLLAQAALPERAAAQSAPATELIDEFVTMEAERESGRKQTETSTMADASTSLVERSSVSDLIGVGANLAGLQLGSGDEEDADSMSATVSLETFTALYGGGLDLPDASYSDPLNRFLRNSSITLGYDDPKDGTAGKATLIGAKIRLSADTRNNVGTDLLPAALMARPATALLRPECSALPEYDKESCWRRPVEQSQDAIAPDYSPEPDPVPASELPAASITSPLAWKDWEREQLFDLRRAAATRRWPASDAERWGALVCRNGQIRKQNDPMSDSQPQDLRAVGSTRILGLVPETAAAKPDADTPRMLGETTPKQVLSIEEFFPNLRMHGPASRLADAIAHAADYIGWLACGNTGEFAAQVAPAPESGNANELPKGDFRKLMGEARTAKAKWFIEGAPEVSFEALTTLAAQAQRFREEGPSCERSLLRAPCAEDPGAVGQEARDVLKNKVSEDMLTTFGQAVRHWALGNRKEAFEALRKFIGERTAELSETQQKSLAVGAGKLVDEINKRTEFAVDFGSKLRNDGGDEYAGTLILELSPIKDCDNPLYLFRVEGEPCNYLRYLNITLNAGFEYREQDGKDAYGGNAALELKLPFNPLTMFYGAPDYTPNINRTLPTISVSGRANWFDNKKDQYIGQAKLEIPIGKGVSIPLSVTVANRTEFVEETEVRGIVGFTIDTGALTNIFNQGLAPINE